MAKCVNCVRDAEYIYTVTNTFKLNYCQTHMPKSLTTGKHAGVERVVAPVESAVEAVAKASKKKPVIVEEAEPTPAPEVEEPADDADN